MDDGKLPARAGPRLRWTEERREGLLEELAMTGDITRSALAVGMTASALWKLRMRDEEFRERFAEAIEAGYQRLEAELLARSLGRETPEGEPAIDVALALRLLRQRGAAQRGRRPTHTGFQIKRATEREIEDELVKKLKGLAKRLALIA